MITAKIQLRILKVNPRYDFLSRNHCKQITPTVTFKANVKLMKIGDICVRILN